jgi:hypothetical protein
VITTSARGFASERVRRHDLAQSGDAGDSDGLADDQVEPHHG